MRAIAAKSSAAAARTVTGASDEAEFIAGVPLQSLGHVLGACFGGVSLVVGLGMTGARLLVLGDDLDVDAVVLFDGRCFDHGADGFDVGEGFFPKAAFADVVGCFYPEVAGGGSKRFF